MTHTLHRKGTRESLNRDYIFLCMAAKGINEDGADDKMREFLRIVIKHGAVNIGDMRTGNIFCCNPEEIIGKVTSTSTRQITPASVDIPLRASFGPKPAWANPTGRPSSRATIRPS